jgi:Fe-S cluster assembly iron-binding protein IscA
MIKLLDLLKEIEDASGIWYHGSISDINQKDLDPLYRESNEYKSNADKLKWSSTGSARSGTGIYFGRNKESKGPTSPMSYTGFDSTSAPFTQGFMYEMKLKSIANVKDHSALHNVYKTQYEKFRQEGIDVLISGNELNVLNVDAIDYFKKIMQWKIVPGLFPFNNRGEKGKIVIFNDDQELLDYVKKELGDFRLVKAGDKQYYQPTDENVRKAFQYSTERKWFDV